ncbi:MAG: chemotaxis protein CheA [Clostridiales bacterium]|nr:chemotaxis protein CheA [Clostridiales bacterium]
MSDQYTNEPMLDIYIFETIHLIELLEETVLNGEKSGGYNSEAINEIFRIMHTIKGSSAMMLFSEISNLAHAIEDLFFFLREEKPTNLDYSTLTDLVFESVDFIKLEIEKIKNGDKADGAAASIVEQLKVYIHQLKNNNTNINEDKPTEQETTKTQYYISQSSSDKLNYKHYYKAEIFFEDGCEMENIRAYTIIHSLKNITSKIKHIPTDIIENDGTIQQIREQGFVIYFKANQTFNEMHEFFMKSLFLKDLELTELQDDESWPADNAVQVEISSNIIKGIIPLNQKIKSESNNENQGPTTQGFISVPVGRMDKLMDLVGEMVIAERGSRYGDVYTDGSFIKYIS